MTPSQVVEEFGFDDMDAEQLINWVRRRSRCSTVCVYARGSLGYRVECGTRYAENKDLCTALTSLAVQEYYHQDGRWV